ncbi:hypothetical protein KI387_035414, partial [Taxus chinensis]
REYLHKVMELLRLREQHAPTLLIHHRWDVEKLLAVFVDKESNRCLSEVNVTVLESTNSCSTSHSSIVMCNICMDDKVQEEVTMMECGHYFCNE